MNQQGQTSVDGMANATTTQSMPPPGDGTNGVVDPVEVDKMEDVNTQANRRGRKRTSDVWNYFEEPTENNGERVSKCKGCKKYFSTKSKGGTSHLKDHLKIRCPNRHLTGQATLHFGNKVNNDENELIIEHKFKQEVSRSKLVAMIITHEYPLSMVDHIAFREFVSSLNSKFKMITRNTLRSDILKMFAAKKEALKKFLLNLDSRVALTTDMWTTSNQKKGYIVITAHFVDNDWILRNRTLRFSYVPYPHTKDVLAAIMMDNVYSYGLENKISSVVLDNCSTNDAMMEIIRGKFDTSSLISSGVFLHMRCCAHIINLVVKDGLDAINGEISIIRENIAFWLATAKRIEKFEDAIRTSKICSTKRLVLDCKTRWNSTYLMLETALPYKSIFPKLKRLNTQVKITPPSEEQWDLASNVCEKLEVFYRVTELFSGKDYPTSNLYFTEICEIKIQLKSWLNSDVPTIVNMVVNMIEKFDKYWSSINGLMAVATILDPRSKMECVELFLNLIYEDQAEIETDRIKDLIGALMLEYRDRANDCVNSDTCENQHVVANGSVHIPNYGRGRNLFSIHKQTKKRRKVNLTAEYDRYIEDDVLPDNIDVLGFWKNNCQYPTLRKIAKDLLAIPVSCVASESAFSTGGRVLSPHQSRLQSNTVEALMCLQNWMADSHSISPVQDSFAYATIFEDADNDSCKKGAIDEYEGNDVYMTCNF